MLIPLTKSKSFIIRAKHQDATDPDRYHYLNELRKASPIKTLANQSERAVIAQDLGKSEKFSEKPRVLEVLRALHYIPGERNALPSTKNSKPFKDPASDQIPMMMSHQIYRKIHTPFSPGVVRIKSNSNLAPPAPPPAIASSLRVSNALHKSPLRNYTTRKTTPSRPVRPLVSDSSSSPFKQSQSTTSVSNTQITVRLKSTLIKSNREQAKEDQYSGQRKEGKKEGLGRYFHGMHEVAYKGEFSRDLAHGNGSLKFASGHKIEGTFANGVLQDGMAMIRYKDGGMYHGEIKNGAREGSGTMQYPNGGIYRGSWAKDQRKGLGVIICQGIFFFEGFFNNDYTDGQGILVKKFVFRDHQIDPTEISSKVHDSLDKSSIFGSLTKHLPSFSSLPLSPTDLVYLTLASSCTPIQNLPKLLATGTFLSGRLNGAGMARYGGYGTYIGNFKEGCRHGFGKMQYSDVDHNCNWFPETDGVYVGEWREDLRHGTGTMQWANGSRYSGKFNSDRRHNVTGILVFSNGDVYEGGFVNDIMEGKCVIDKEKGRNGVRIRIRGVMIGGVLANDKAVIEFSDGKVYEGEIAREAPHGLGSFRYTNGNVYDGSVVDGVIEGFGRMVYRNGEIYEGNWENNARSGKGWVYYCDSKEKWEGEWTNDKMIGRLNKL